MATQTKSLATRGMVSCLRRGGGGKRRRGRRLGRCRRFETKPTTLLKSTFATMSSKDDLVRKALDAMKVEENAGEGEEVVDEKDGGSASSPSTWLTDALSDIEEARDRDVARPKGRIDTSFYQKLRRVRDGTFASSFVLLARCQVEHRTLNRFFSARVPPRDRRDEGVVCRERRRVIFLGS